MNIYDIKRLTAETSPYYFSRKTLSFFGQTLRDFSVKKQIDGRYLICAPMYDKNTRRKVGESKRYFNPVNNELEHN